MRPRLIELRAFQTFITLRSSDSTGETGHGFALIADRAPLPGVYHAGGCGGATANACSDDAHQPHYTQASLRVQVISVTTLGGKNGVGGFFPTGFTVRKHPDISAAAAYPDTGLFVRAKTTPCSAPLRRRRSPPYILGLTVN